MIETLNCRAEVSNLAMNTSRTRIVDMVTQDLTRRIAQQIAQMKTTEERGDHHTTFRCEVIVADPADFYRAVQEEARKLAVGYAPPPRWVDESVPITKEQWDDACAGLGTKA